jgi:hypothetical protein
MKPTPLPKRQPKPPLTLALASNIIPMASHGLPRTPRTVALARLLSTIAQNIPAKAA